MRSVYKRPLKELRPMARVRLVLLAVAGAAALSGCQSLRQAVGAEKIAPDEFRVVTKAPLVVPPDFNLRPPRPGEPRPNELRPDLQARAAVFGAQTGAAASPGERVLVAQAGATQVDPRIRNVVDEEGGDIARKPRSFADRVMFFRSSADRGDPLAGLSEADRLRAETAVKDATGGGQVTIQKSEPTGFKLPGM
jgi:hypothetical protein